MAVARICMRGCTLTQYTWAQTAALAAPPRSPITIGTPATREHIRTLLLLGEAHILKRLFRYMLIPCAAILPESFVAFRVLRRVALPITEPVISRDLAQK